MSYSGQTPIISQGQATANQIQTWFESLGPNYTGYAPDGKYKAPPAGLGAAIVSECQRYEHRVVNHDLVAAQVLKETAAWQSKYARERNNPGGIGAINSDPDQALWFSTVAEGIRAHVAHLLVYAVGDGPWTVDDRRYDAIARAGWVGVVTTIGDLNGKWAWPGTSYGQGIAKLANQLLEVGATTVPDSTYPKPPMIWKPSPNKNGYSEPRKIEAICNHIATGSKASNLSWLTNPDSGVSCNFYIARDGTIYEMVPVFSNAWCNGVVNKPDMSNPLIASWVREGVNPNTRTVSIEHEGQASDTLTEAQIASNNKVTAWVASTSGLPVNREHIIGHYQIDSVNKPFCPSFSDDEWERLIGGANALLNGGQKPQDDPDAIEFPETGCKLILGFKGFWEELAGYQPELPYRVLGLPITNEGWATLRDDSGGMVRRRVQICERGSLIWNPDEPRPWDLTLMLKSQEEDIIDFEEDV